MTLLREALIQGIVIEQDASLLLAAAKHDFPAEAVAGPTVLAEILTIVGKLPVGLPGDGQAKDRCLHRGERVTGGVGQNLIKVAAGREHEWAAAIDRSLNGFEVHREAVEAI